MVFLSELYLQKLRESYLQKLCKLRLKGTEDYKIKRPLVLQTSAARKQTEEATHLQTQATFQGNGKIIFKVEPSVQRVKQKTMKEVFPGLES